MSERTAPRDAASRLARRAFLQWTGAGIGPLALSSILPGLHAASSPANGRPHFRPRARRCIFLFLAGAPSQIDLFDPKPRLRELDGQPLPSSLTDKVRFAFIQKDSAVLMGSPYRFARCGRSGMEISELLPNLRRHADKLCLIRSMHCEAFNHHPGQLLMNTGIPLFGHPSIGSWLLYGLGSESENLPGYVVLSSGRGSSGGASNWGSGFLPSQYQGVMFRNRGDPILHLTSPAGVDRELEARSLSTASALNRLHHQRCLDPEVEARVASSELAFRMQVAAPELLDLRGESKATLARYGVDRDDSALEGGRGKQGHGTFASFSMNCLLARRLVERGVRFVNLMHASWDHHSNLDPELRYNCRMADQPVAALLEDLEQRGLLEDTLVVWASEFGRTPLGENRRGRAANTGRDHHPFAFSMWMAGAGVRGGHVHGETDELGWGVVRDPVHVHDFQATLLHLFGFDHERLTHRFKGRDQRLTDVGGRVVRALLTG